jgi:hypothetical protein
MSCSFFLLRIETFSQIPSIIHLSTPQNLTSSQKLTTLQEPMTISPFIVPKSDLYPSHAKILQTNIPSSFQKLTNDFSTTLSQSVTSLLLSDSPISLSPSLLNVLTLSPERDNFHIQILSLLHTAAASISSSLSSMRDYRLIASSWKSTRHRFSHFVRLFSGFGSYSSIFHSDISSRLQSDTNFITFLNDVFCQSSPFDWAFCDFLQFLRDTSTFSPSAAVNLSVRFSNFPEDFPFITEILELFQGFPILDCFFTSFQTQTQLLTLPKHSFEMILLLYRIIKNEDEKKGFFHRIEQYLIVRLEEECKVENPLRILQKYFKKNPPILIRDFLARYARQIIIRHPEFCCALLAREIHRKFVKLRYFVPESLLKLYSQWYRILPARELFLALHRDLLIQRLLLGRKWSVLADARFQSIANLPRIGEILSDFEKSERIVEQFSNPIGCLHLSVVDNSFFTHRLSGITIWPSEIRTVLTAFGEFFSEKRRRNTLNWDLQLSSCRIEVASVRLRCSALCGIFLLAASKTRKTRSEIANETMIPLPQIEELCLMLEKREFLRYDEKKRIEIDVSNVKGKICFPLSSSLKESTEPNQFAVFDAKLVRILKERGKLSPEALLAYVNAELPVILTLDVLNTRIQGLQMRGLVFYDNEGLMTVQNSNS